ncbi:MAG: hypothetical protein HY608_02475 [Planctomycetes bacterium]|nr:hypothetical protein [Planctomycetota bacterium]
MNPEALAWTVGLAVVSAAAGLAVWKLRGRLPLGLASGGGSDQAQLFGELCRAHDLSGEDAGWMERSARLSGVGTPSELFVSPQAWDRVRAALPRAEGARIDALYERLFL